jgi:hypothetical protein
MDRLGQLRAEYRRVIHSMEYAYAMGHSHTIGTDPRLDAVVDRAERLAREIAELAGAEER